MAAGLEGLEGLVLQTIVSKLDPRDAAAAACVSTRLRSAASDDAIWRGFCAHYLAVCDQPVDPDGNPCPSFKEAYRRWFEYFGMYPLSLVRRTRECWNSIRSWMAVNLPEVNDTLRKGASEAEIKSAEEMLGVKLPAPTKVLYRMCDGQQTLTPNPAEKKLLAALGIIGGYEFYNHIVNVHLLPLRLVMAETKRAREQGFLTRANYIIVAACYYRNKFFFLNCANGQLYVGTQNLIKDGEMMPCVPKTLLRPTVAVGHDMLHDALLLWLEEHSRRLQSGMVKTRELRNCRSICLFPERPPYCSVAVTNGVQVRASAIFVPEGSDPTGGENYYYSYSIRMSLLPEGCMLDGIYYSTCQLYSRHWIIRSKDVIVCDTGGEAVIGKYPVLSPDKEEFVYQSCTPIPWAPGSVEGSFTFVPGRLSKPEGRPFDVKVAPFILEEPEYIF